MTDVSDLIVSALGEHPQDFTTAFGDLLKTKVAEKVAERKLELQQDLFGAPEGLEEPEKEEKENETT